MKYFRSISLFSVVALSGCGEPSYEQCIRAAVKDGKTEYGITVLTDLCDAAKLRRLETRDKKCFAELTEKFGEPAVQKYKDLVGSQYGQCDPSVDVPSWVTQPENEVMSTDAVEAAVEGAEAAVDGAGATADAVEAGADAAR